MASPIPVGHSEVRTRILVADDHAVIRDMVRSTLEHHLHFEVCGEVEDGAKAVEEALKLKPDVVVMNVSMPVMNGFEAARKIKVHLPDTIIIILSSNSDRHFIEEAKIAGARGYVTKTETGEALVKTIEAAMAGGDFVTIG